MKKFMPLGIKLLCWIYMFNTILFILSLMLFYNRIIVLGNDPGRAVSLLIKFIFVVIPLYLYLRLWRLKKDAWFLAIAFHMFFLINNISGYLEYKGYTYSIVHITGLYGSVLYSPAQMFVSAISTLVNLLILGYLYKVRHIFTHY